MKKYSIFYFYVFNLKLVYLTHDLNDLNLSLYIEIHIISKLS